MPHLLQTPVLEGQEQCDPECSALRGGERESRAWEDEERRKRKPEVGIQEAPEALLTKLPVLEPQILPLLSPESVCVCVCLPRPVLVDFSLLFSYSFSVLCARAPVHGAGSQCLPFRVHLLSLVSACLLCVFLSPSYYVPASLPLCPAFLHSLSLPGSLLVSVSVLPRCTSCPSSTTTTSQHTWAEGLSPFPHVPPHPGQLLTASQSWPLLPAPLEPGGRGAREEGRAAWRAHPFLPFQAGRLGQWAF